MVFKNILAFLLIFSPLLGTVQNSIIPLMDQMSIVDLSEKINSVQKEAIATIDEDAKMRVMSFNMLFNLPMSEVQLDEKDRWEQRASRLIEYLQYAKPDVIGSQELQSDQLELIINALGNEYAYYGEETGGEILAIFFKRDRFQLLEGKTYPFSECTSKRFVVCQFLDQKTGCEFTIINTHLSFGDIEKRLYEASTLRDFISDLNPHVPLIVTGDFNTFPFRQEYDLPFYDGNMILSILQDSSVKDSMERSLLGHFGLIASTSYSSKEKRTFCDYGTPGVILDHIFTNEKIQVIRHGIDPALVDGNFTSDHFPVVCDVIVMPSSCGSVTRLNNPAQQT